jgi:hypothetical protein
MLEDFLKGNHFVLDLATLPWPWGTRELSGSTKGVEHPFDGQCERCVYGSGQVQGVPRPRGPNQLIQAQEDPPQQPYRPARSQSRAPAMGARADQRQQARLKGRRRRFCGAESARGGHTGAEQVLAGPIPVAPATASGTAAFTGQRWVEGHGRNDSSQLLFVFFWHSRVCVAATCCRNARRQQQRR